MVDSDNAVENNILSDSRRRPGRPKTSDADETRGTQSVERTVAILEAIAFAEDGIGFAELAAQLKLPTATAHRMLAAVVKLGFVKHDESTGLYTVGDRLMRLATRALRHGTEFRALARPLLHELVDRTGETANLAYLDGTEAAYVDQVESRQMVRAAKFLRVRLYCSALGKSLLAFQPDDAMEELTARLTLEPLTERTIVTPEALRAELFRVRKRGFATDDEEIELGVRCIAAPILVDGRAVAAVSIAGPTTRVTLEKVEPLSEIVRDVAKRLSDAVEERFPDLVAGNPIWPETT